MSLDAQVSASIFVLFALETAIDAIMAAANLERLQRGLSINKLT